MQYKRLRYHLAAFLMIPLVILVWQQHSHAQTPKPLSSQLTASANIIQTDEQGLIFSLTTPDYTVNQDGALSIAGLEMNMQQPGAPALPAYTTYIALPPAATVAGVQVDEMSVLTSQVTAVQPVPRFDVSYDDITDEASFAATAVSLNQQLATPIYEQDPAVYSANSDYPAMQYTLSAPMYYRDWRLVQLTVYPIRYNPASQTVTQVRDMVVSLRFSGAEMGQVRPLPTSDPISESALPGVILNHAQGRAWRHLPDTVLNAPATILPIGQQTFKIEINQTGIYEITGAALQAAGMNIAAVNPTTIQMTYRGQPVAYQLIHNGDNDFDLTDKIRFYGWTFTGSRLEKQFIGDNNVFWLWANGSPATIPTAANDANLGYPIVSTFPESITLDTPEQYHFHTRTNLWDTYPNEPDAWYMDYLQKTTQPTLARTYTINLPHPAPAGPDAQLLAEITVRDTPVIDNVEQNHIGRVAINNSDFGETAWPRVQRNVNVTTTVPLTTLLSGDNTFRYTSVTTSTNSARERIYLNRVTVAYLRQLVAVDNQLIYRMDGGAQHEFHVAGFNEGSAANVLVWDISQPNLPVQINMTGNISPTGALEYTYKIGRAHGGAVQMIAATTGSLLTPAAISAYTPPNLNPAGGGAAWVAISHADFLTEAARLAAHRTDPTFSNLSTQVVDIQDVINQYGYGLPLPKAIHHYLTYALGNWTIPPRYVTIFGDATFNPLHLPCLSLCDANFDQNAPQYVPTDLVFKDIHQGLVPSDHTLVTISGDDLIPDLAIGRIAAETLVQATAVVDKIILYETQQFSPTARGYHDNILFVADMTDEAGNFCHENDLIGQLLPASFNQQHLCLPERTAEAVATLRTSMQTAINMDGVGLLNYRGHGSLNNWVKGEFHPVSATDTDFWFNTDKPTIILSADCLDGYFAYPGVTGLGEAFLKLNDPIFAHIGSVAHWSSTGLGTTFEHTALLRGFYTGLFRDGLTAIGDSIVYAKTLYWLSGFYPDAEMYSFTLQGDPAMQLYRPDLSLQKTAVTGSVEPGDTATFALQIANNGLYPAYTTITDTLPTLLSFINATATVSFTHTTTANQVVFNLLEPLTEGSAATITIHTQVAADSPIGAMTNSAVAWNPGLDLNLNDNTDTANIFIFTVTYRSYLPLLRQP